MAKECLEPQNSSMGKIPHTPVRVVGIEWTIHPIKRNWKVSIGVVSFLVALCAAIYFSFNSVAFLLLSVAILVSSLSSFFFPTTYALRDDCITIKSFLRRFSKQWSFFKSYYPDKNGVLLSPFLFPSRLENFRGVYIRFGNNRSEAIGFIRGKMEALPPVLETDT